MKRAEIRKLINWAKIHKKYYLMHRILEFNSRLFIENTDILFWKEVLIIQENISMRKIMFIIQLIIY